MAYRTFVFYFIFWHLGHFRRWSDPGSALRNHCGQPEGTIRGAGIKPMFVLGRPHARQFLPTVLSFQLPIQGISNTASSPVPLVPTVLVAKQRVSGPSLPPLLSIVFLFLGGAPLLVEPRGDSWQRWTVGWRPASMLQRGPHKTNPPQHPPAHGQAALQRPAPPFSPSGKAPGGCTWKKEILCSLNCFWWVNCFS